LFFWNWDVARSTKEFQKAIALDPQDVETHHWYATTLLTLRTFPEAQAEIEKARELNPASPSILVDEALIEYDAGKSNEAIAKLRRLADSQPQLVSVHRFLASALLDKNDLAGFVDESERAAAISKDPDEQAVAAAARHGLASGGKQGMLKEMMLVRNDAVEQKRSSGFDSALLAARLGDKQQALKYLLLALEAHDYMLLTTSHGVIQDLLKDDLEFQKLQSHIRARMSGQRTETP